MGGISKKRHRLFQIQTHIEHWSKPPWWSITHSYVEIGGERVWNDTNNRPYIPNMKSKPGVWYLHMREDVLILTTDYAKDAYVAGSWADVYPAYKRYALMLMKE